MTNILVEGGGELLGSLFDARQIDEIHVFIAPKLFGGQKARVPIAGAGVEQVAEGLLLTNPESTTVGGDIYVRGRIKH
jgi:diaminohydroxyphosphoribosylaminopyrimidine deaminase/5-amino-6-(5-phosphoribosylamino)uracil reductase